MKIKIGSKFDEWGNPIFDKSKIQGFIKKVKDDSFILTFETFHRPRSLLQNNLFHKYIMMIGADLGYYTSNEIQELKIQIKSQCPFLIENPEATFPKLKSTAELSVEEMAKLITWLQVWASNTLNILLPDPELM